VSVLALALHEAVEAAGGDVAAYRWTAMEMFDRGRVEGQQLRQLAARVAGRDLDEEAVRAALRSVGQSHEQALSLQVFGTPTLVSGGASTYLKLTEQPTPARARRVYDVVMAVLTDTPRGRRDQATRLRHPVRVPPQMKALGRTTRRSTTTSDSGLVPGDHSARAGGRGSM
jgi:hypothetical protein